MRVVVVEDQILFQELLVSLLEEKLSHEVVGIAADGETAIEMIRKERPDLVILDILIPKLSGIRVARTIMDEIPAVRILALSAETDPKTIYQIHQLHLPAFVDKKEASADVLEEAIQRVLDGKRYFSASHQRTMAELKRDPVAFQKILTKREQEILTHIGAGLSDSDIGGLVGLTQASVQSHRRNLFRKLDVHSTPELIRFANECGFWKTAFPGMDLTDNTYHLHD
jgi:two-component system nitrate/nitrite response regulator NarL